MLDDDKEIALRTHIHNLLLDYAYTHLTVDHVQFSETLVSEILPKILKPIPALEPGLLVLPDDPFETLKARLQFDATPAFDEVWQPSAEALQFLKDTLTLGKRKLRTQRVWEEDYEFDYEKMAHRPMTPILSRASRERTPSLGKSVKEVSLATILSSRGVLRVADENLPEEKPLKLDDCLDTKLTINASVHSDMVDYQQRSPFLSRPTPRSFPTHAAHFLRSQSPKYEELLRPLSPPAFARDQQVRGSKAEVDHNVLGQVKLAPVEVEEVDPDIANENMVVINGWAAITSSASTPSLSSAASEVDELDDEDTDMWRPSSSTGVPVTIETLQVAKMDEPIFPRTARPRTGRTGKAGENAKQSLSTFMSAHLPFNSSVRILTTPKSDDAVARRIFSPPPSASAVSLSMLGQHPQTDSSSEPPSDSAGDALDKDIRRMLKEYNGYTRTKSYKDVIMHERLDEKESMFMDVPALPSPNEYLRTASTKIHDNTIFNMSLARPGQNSESLGFLPPVTLKKVQGLKSLNLELSWRPFAFGAKIPTHAELIDVECLFPAEKDFRKFQDEALTQGAANDLLAGFLIDFKDSADPLPLNHDLRFLEDLHSNIDSDYLDARFDPRRDFDNDESLLLSRSERLGLSSYQLYQNFNDATANEILTYDDSQSYETLDFSSAITPDNDPQFPTTQNVEDAVAFADTFAYAVTSQIPRDDFDNRYDGYQTYEDLDDSRDKKRRRLSSAELDALCTMKTMSQSFSLTVNPKDLMLPETTNLSYTYECDPPAPAMMTAYNSQSAFLLSQSQSLSLSLNEDSTSQELDPINTVSNKLNGAVYCDGVRNCQKEMSGIVADTIQVGSHRPISPAPQPDISFKSVSERQYIQQANARDNGSLDQSALPLNRQHPEPGPLFTTEAIDLGPPRQSRLESQSELNGKQVDKQRKPHLPSPSALLCDNHTLSTFLHLRGRKSVASTCLPVKEPEGHSQQSGNTTDIQDSSLCQVYQSAPPDLLSDTRAFSIPELWQPPTTEHTYLVSVDFVQQRALVNALESPFCAVRLVERDSVTPLFVPASAAANPSPYSADISVIVGPHAGVVLFSLCALPSQTAYKMLLDTLATYSWRFSIILLLLTAFPRSHLVRTASTAPNFRDGPSSYSPPVLKAARRVRRDLGLRDGTGEKRTSCAIELAFADDVEQAARIVRAFGDVALRDSVVDYTHYIGEEEQEGERDLAEVEGMNAFCAALILRCCTLGEFLEMPPEQRVEGLEDLIGKDRIEHVNAILGKRMQAMNMDLPSSSDFLSSLNE